MTDIDWFAVECACTGTAMKLTKEEQTAAIRRMLPRIHGNDFYCPPGTLYIGDVARLITATERQVQRIKAALPPAEPQDCPVCGQTMWAPNGVVEPHSDRPYTECPLTGQTIATRRRGLAALRPDLYRWVS